MRRILIASLLAACGGDDPVPVPDSDVRVYVGGYGSQIHAFAMDPETFRLGSIGAVDAAQSPSFLAFEPGLQWLAAAAEGADVVETFSIGADGTLASLGEFPVGTGPAHVAIDPTGAWVLVANYGGGTISALPVIDGTLGPAVEVAADDTVHQVVVHPNTELAFAPCLESNNVLVYSFDAATGAMEVTSSASVPPGAGPRHLAISRTGGFAWVMNEVASSVTTFRIARDGTLTAGGTVSSLPASFTGDNTGAEIALHPTLNVLYASNRGHDSIAVFDIAGDGSLALRTTYATGADPRHFSIVPAGDGMLVANQSSGSISAFRIDTTTGDLTAIGEVAQVPEPAFVGAIELP